MIRRDGFDFAEGGEPPEHAIAPLRDRLAIRPPGDASVIGNRDLFGGLAATAMYHPLVRTGVDSGPTSSCVTRASTPRQRSLATARHPDGPGRHLARPDRVGIAHGRLGRPSRIGSTGSDRRRSFVAVLTRFPETLDPRPFRGPSAAAASTTERAAARLVARRLPGPLVYATLGTVLPHMTDALDHYRLLIDALDGIDARVLLTIGRHLEPAALGSVPDHVRVERWVDQRQVVAEAALTVCHGGSGTLFGSIAAGVPVVVLPSFADQFANADIVEHHRLGRVVRGGREEPIDDRSARLTATGSPPPSSRRSTTPMPRSAAKPSHGNSRVRRRCAVALDLAFERR